MKIKQSTVEPILEKDLTLRISQEIYEKMPIKSNELYQIGSMSKLSVDALLNTAQEYRQIMHHLRVTLSTDVTKQDLESLYIWASNSSSYILGVAVNKK